VGEISNTTDNSISESFYSIREFLRYVSYPTLLLWLTTFLGWFVYINMNIYFTDYVGEVVYGGSPTAADYELASLYNRGVRMAALCRAVEDIVIFVYSLMLKWVSDGHSQVSSLQSLASFPHLHTPLS